ncbi:MAG: hypothetical protein NTU49_04555, partial [Gammaproteobacteria bacterium]|nr:hypothetical protein [Gammaproteobacteria bacterium]
MHCKTQEQSLKTIASALDKNKHPQDHDALLKIELSYQNAINKLETLQCTPANNQEKLKTPTDITNNVIKTDQEGSATLTTIRQNLPDSAKKESLTFTDHAQFF